MEEDQEYVTVPSVGCIRLAPKAILCEFAATVGRKWVAKSLILPGIDWRPGVRAGLTIPLWVWRRIQGENLGKPAPQSEYEVDRYFTRVKILCETRDKLDPSWFFDQLLGPMYLAMRQELHGMEVRIWTARDQLFELGNHTPPPVTVKLEEIARRLCE